MAMVVTVMVVAKCIMAVVKRMVARAMPIPATDLRTDTGIRATDVRIPATGMATVVVGITVIGTLAMVAIGMVAGGPMAWVHAGAGRPAVGFGFATDVEKAPADAEAHPPERERATA
jgi:hypothetical protein